MISADTIRRCSYLDTISLETLIRRFYPNDTIIRSEFLGISNGEQFVYRISYPNQFDDPAKLHHGNVYVWQGSNGELVADY